MNIESKFNASGPAERDIAPVVELPSAGVPGVVIAGLAVVLAVLLFLYLDSRRTAPQSPGDANRSDDAAFSAPPPLMVPPTVQAPSVSAPLASPSPAAPAIATSSNPLPPSPAFRSVPMPASPPIAAPLMPRPEMLPPAPALAPPTGDAAPQPVRDSSPAVVIDSGVPVGPADVAGASPEAGPANADGSKKSQLSGGAVRPSPIANRTTVIAAGTLIPAVLETPIDSSRPGLVRAIVSKDATGFDGRRVLIPRGSRVIGEFEGDRRSGHNGVLVNWTRLIRPDGVAIDLDSPATDSQGESGIPGQAHGFFLGQFLGSALQSALYVGESLLAPRASTTVLVGLPNGAATTVAQQSLAVQPNHTPRITVKEGVVLNIFVAHDLDFSSPQTANH